MNIAVIGCGNMATPIVKRIYSQNKSVKFYTYTPSQSRAIDLANNVNGVHIASLDDFKNIDIWIIACKPQQVEELSHSLDGKLANQKIISILASTPLNKLNKYFKTSEIIRIMPNTPCVHGNGISLMVSHAEASDSFSNIVKNLFDHCGETIIVNNEKEFDELTAFSGSGPAYVFRFAMAYVKKLEDMNYDSFLARKLINQLFLGSSQLMSLDDRTLNEMVASVTSKGGVTIEAIKELEQNSIDNIVSDSINSAVLRGKQIAQELS